MVPPHVPLSSGQMCSMCLQMSHVHSWHCSSQCRLLCLLCTWTAFNGSQQWHLPFQAKVRLCPILRSNALLHALQITSLFLHWFPACVAWTERWHPDVHVREHNRKAGTAAMEEWHNASLWDLVVLPMAPYLLWALLYYLKVGAFSAAEKVGGWRR